MQQAFRFVVLFVVLVAGTGWGIEPAQARNLLPDPIEVTLKGLPDFVEPGQSYEAVVIVTLAESKPLTPRTVVVSVMSDTPFGFGMLTKETFIMQPGETREINIKLVVGKTASGSGHAIKAVAETGPYVAESEHLFGVL